MKHLTPERAAKVAHDLREMFVVSFPSPEEETFFAMALEMSWLDENTLLGLRILSTAAEPAKDGRLVADWPDGCGLDDDDQEPVKAAIAWIQSITSHLEEP